MRILVVEDDSKIASFVVRGLKQSGYAADHAPDGETGLALADSTDYDAMIVDVMLPQLDGISLVKRLRAARRVTPSSSSAPRVPSMIASAASKLAATIT